MLFIFASRKEHATHLLQVKCVNEVSDRYSHFARVYLSNKIKLEDQETF